nr:MAG TPA: hypothetical protein [Caudoviricetes sp.]
MSSKIKHITFLHQFLLEPLTLNRFKPLCFKGNHEKQFKRFLLSLLFLYSFIFSRKKFFLSDFYFFLKFFENIGFTKNCKNRNLKTLVK